jgi:hypothetical protein
MRFPEVLLWTVLSIMLYGVVRLIVVGIAGLVWLGFGSSPEAAAAWATFATPVATAIAAAFVLQTNVRNRQLHFVLACVVFASALPLFHLAPGTGQLDGTTAGTATFLRAAATLVGGGIGLALVRRRRAKWAAEQPALPTTAA